MAKSDAVPAEPSKPEPVIRIDWPKDSKGGIQLTGDMSGLALGRRVRVTIEGTTTGYAMQDYGCSINVKGQTVKVDDLGEPSEGDSLTTTLDKNRARVKKA